MSLDLISLAKVGLKLLVAIGGGYIVYKCLKTDSKEKDSVARSSGNTNTEDNVVQTSEVMVSPKKETIEEKGRKVVDGLRLTSAICSSAMGVLKSFAGISGGIDSLFSGNLNYFDTYSMASQYGNPSSWNPGYGAPGYPPGDFPWNRPDDNNIYNTPIYKGKDFKGDDMYWIRRPNGVIEVW